VFVGQRTGTATRLARRKRANGERGRGAKKAPPHTKRRPLVKKLRLKRRHDSTPGGGSRRRKRKDGNQLRFKNESEEAPR